MFNKNRFNEENNKFREDIFDTNEDNASSSVDGSNTSKKARRNKRVNKNIRFLVGISLFSALAFVSSLFKLPVQFLSFEAKDAVVCIGSFIYGPISGIIVSLISALIEFLSVSTTGVYGFLMNFISSAVYALTASLIYKMWKTFNGAIVGSYSAVVTMTLTMLLANMFITPYYMGVDRTTVINMIPTLFLPFNVAKGLLNTAITLILYKPVVIALSHAHLIESHEKTAKFTKKSITSLVIGLLTIAVAITVFMLISK